MPARRRHIIFATLAVIAGVLLGLNEPRNHGYVIAYSIIAVFFLSALIAMASTVMLIPRGYRSFAVSGITTAVTLLMSFYATIAVANAAGAWDTRMVSFGPDVPASIVVLFREDATDSAISDFVTSVVATPHPGGGSPHLPGMQSLIAVRVGSHDGYAIGFRSDITTAQRRSIDQRINSSRIVWRRFEHVAPNKIVLSGGTAAN